MLKAFLFLLAVSFFNSASVFGQTKSSTSYTKQKNEAVGFYGKRFFLQLGGGLHHNTLLKIASSKERNLRDYSYYLKYRNQIKKDQFNYSLYANMGIMLKERFALGVDVNYYYGDIFLQNIGMKNYYDQFGNYVYSQGYDSRVKYNTLRIMPRIEIGSTYANMPTGLVHVLGMGVELSKLKSGTYASITGVENYSVHPDSIIVADRKFTFKDETVFNLTLLYGLEYRLPISKNIAWNFGGYVHLNIPIQELISDGLLGISYGYGYDNYDEEYKLQLSRYRVQNLFSLRTGIVIML